MAETYEGSPCKSGHTTRYKSSRHCVECRREWEKRRTRESRGYRDRRQYYQDTRESRMEYQKEYEGAHGKEKHLRWRVERYKEDGAAKHRGVLQAVELGLIPKLEAE